MVRVNRHPLLASILDLGLLVDEVTPCAVQTVPLLCESVASLGLIGAIGLHVNPQLLRSMCELAFSTVRTEAFLHIISAKRALGLRSDVFVYLCSQEVWMQIWVMFMLISLGGGIWAWVTDERGWVKTTYCVVIDHGTKVINDYRTCLLIIPYNRSTLKTPNDPTFINDVVGLHASNWVRTEGFFKMLIIWNITMWLMFLHYEGLSLYRHLAPPYLFTVTE